MALVEAVRSRVRRALVARSPGIDLSRLDRVPERLTWPLKREGMEPFHRVEELRETKGPVARVVTVLGVEVWLVTGDAEARVMLADVRSVGVQGDGRTYGHPVVLRPVSSEDAMTADWARLPYDVLETISTRITNEVREVNRVVVDITSKPPGTIEWE